MTLGNLHEGNVFFFFFLMEKTSVHVEGVNYWFIYQQVYIKPHLWTRHYS